MAIAQPALVSFEYGQAGSWTVALSPAEDVTGWTVSCVIRDRNGGTALVTKTSANVLEIAVTDTGNGVFVVYFSEADLSLTYGPGAYVIQFMRTNSGSSYPITDPSTLLLTPAASTDYPTLTNLGELLAHIKNTDTVSDTDAKFYLQLLSSAERCLQDLCGREFFYKERTEYFDAPLRGNLWTRETPIVSITSIKFDGAGGFGELANTFGSTTLLDSTTDYYFRKGRDGLGWTGEIFTSRRVYGGGGGLFGSWTPGWLATKVVTIPGAYQVIYSGGFRLIPAPIKTAIFEIVADRASAAQRGVATQSESGENYSYSLGDWQSESMKLLSVQQVVATYRRGDTLVG